MSEAQNWPKDNYEHGSNEWEHDIGAFAKLLQDNADNHWWGMDTKLKYLNVRVDTRDGGFVLFDRDNNRISPDRVTTAIKKWDEFLDK